MTPRESCMLYIDARVADHRSSSLVGDGRCELAINPGDHVSWHVSAIPTAADREMFLARMSRSRSRRSLESRTRPQAMVGTGALSTVERGQQQIHPIRFAAAYRRARRPRDRQLRPDQTTGRWQEIWNQRDWLGTSCALIGPPPRVQPSASSQLRGLWTRSGS